MAYGEKNKIITEETAFWVLPWKKISIWISGPIILIVIIILGIKRYNRRGV